MQLIISRKWIIGLLSLATGTRFFANRSEAVLVRAARSGDPNAFEDLKRLYEEPLRRFVRRRLPAQEVDDVLQDTWISAWESLGSFNGDTKFRSWTFRICFFKIQDYWRRQLIRRTVDWSSCDHSYLPKEFALADLRSSLDLFWNQCPPEQREILSMYYGDGLTLNEIARVLALNVNTVKYRFYRAHECAAALLPESIDEVLS